MLSRSPSGLSKISGLFSMLSRSSLSVNTSPVDINTSTDDLFDENRDYFKEAGKGSEPNTKPILQSPETEHENVLTDANVKKPADQDKQAGLGTKQAAAKKGILGFFPKIKQLFEPKKTLPPRPRRPREPLVYFGRTPSSARENVKKPKHSEVQKIRINLEVLRDEPPVYVSPEYGLRAKASRHFRKDLEHLILEVTTFTDDLNFIANNAGHFCRHMCDSTFDCYLLRDKVMEYFDQMKYQLQMMDHAQETVLYLKNNKVEASEVYEFARNYAEWKTLFAEYECLMLQYPALFEETNKGMVEANAYARTFLNHESIMKRLDREFKDTKIRYIKRESLRNKYLTPLREHFKAIRKSFLGTEMSEKVGEFLESLHTANKDLYDALDYLNKIHRTIKLTHQTTRVTDRMLDDLMSSLDASE